jgi:glycosyltransferase involved in cell wall biosynthesis
MEYFQPIQGIMKILFWVSGLAILYAYAGYALLLKLWPKMKYGTNDCTGLSEFEPTISIVIPVYNEAEVLRDKIENTLSLDYPKEKREIIVVSDGSTDETGEIVQGFAMEGVKYFEQPERKGKAGALNRGLREAKNEIIVFTDASIFLEKAALRHVVRPFSNSPIGCVSGEDYIPGGGAEGVYGRYELFLRRLESHTGSIVGASGCFYAQRLSLCEPFPEGMAPDFFSVLKTVEKGYRAVTEPLARGRMKSVPDPHREFQRKVRTFVRGITTLMHCKDMLNPFRYGIFSFELISHKIMRWIVGLFLITLFVSNIFLLGSNLYLLCFIVQAALYMCSFVGWLTKIPSSIFRIPLYFTTVNIAVLMAWIKYFSGFRIEIWEPSKR